MNMHISEYQFLPESYVMGKGQVKNTREHKTENDGYSRARADAMKSLPGIIYSYFLY